MKIYLDNCSFNRPFDDQSQIRIRIEAEAKLHIQSLIVQGKLDLVWSYILEYENLANPYTFRQIVVDKWKGRAVTNIKESDRIVNKAELLTELNIKAKDALHIACAIDAGCRYLITTDDRMIGKNSEIDEIEILNPTDMIKIVEV